MCHAQIQLAVTTMAAIAFAAPADAFVSIFSDDRKISSWVWISGCPSETQSDFAQNFLPFDSALTVDHDCGNGESFATSTQISALGDHQLTGMGSATFGAAGVQNVVIHAMARSEFDVTFHLKQAREFTLTGTISASRTGMPPGYFATVTVDFSGPAGDVFSTSLQPAPNQTLTDDFSIKGELQPGTYTFFAYAQTVVDMAFNNVTVGGDASFDFALAFEVPGDVNGDGSVNVDDLLAVIAAWGNCPPTPPCPGDADGDGDVDVDDLLLVINNWS